MEIKQTSISGLLIIQPKIFIDNRGYFFESYNKSALEQENVIANFIQDNQSLSHKGVLRGLHFQAPPYAQGKLVRVIKGAVYDVAVDIRKKSSTYGKWFGIELTEENNTQFYIPEGFAHGFLTLKDNTIFSYKCTNIYNKSSEGCLLWNDSDLNINWNFDAPIISEKDALGLPLKEFISPF
ncbi:MAG: dTDP-4-dehydrorhamnose 3,5-epimerase [Bacteroidetes bacterium]|nr:dTDP-4-dehydrorhamnose 3,5-epimerase [Bacteroidota bacterium]